MLSFFPRGVLDGILYLNESVSEDFPSYSYIILKMVGQYDTMSDLIALIGQCDLYFMVQ